MRTLGSKRLPHCRPLACVPCRTCCCLTLVLGHASHAVCIIVGEFVSKSRAVAGAGVGGGVNVSVWGTPERWVTRLVWCGAARPGLWTSQPGGPERWACRAGGSLP